jgi:hypothetical protein
MKHETSAGAAPLNSPTSGDTEWLLERLLKPFIQKLRSARRSKPRLEFLERITLAPKQSLALVEAEGRRFLVATSPEGGPAFFALDGDARPALRSVPRASW